MKSGFLVSIFGVSKGVPVGTMLLSSLLYVDDILDISASTQQRLESHNEAVTFTNENNLTLSGTKCYTMAMNHGGQHLDPLKIDEEKEVVPSKEIVYLGDVFNDQGSNDGLIRDRVNRGVKALVSISALINETNLGTHEVSVWLLLYRSLFLSTVLFNSETWSRIKDSEMKQLKVIQMKMIKRIFNLPSSFQNSFLLLELGILPIEVEIHKRQLMYLHRIVMLPQDDPVRQMFQNLVVFDQEGEENWWSQIEPLLVKYGLPDDLCIIEQLSTYTFKNLVNKGTQHVAVRELKSECSSKKKTADLKFEAGTQNYLKKLFPCQAKTVLKARSKTLDIKRHNSYKFDVGDSTCRLCGVHDETLEHIVNCGREDMIQVDMDDLELPDDLRLAEVSRYISRIKDFLENVKDDDNFRE